MTAPNAMLQSAFMLAQDLNTRGLQGWIQDNVIPLVLLGIAIILLWIGGRGDNAGVARRSVGLIVGLIALGIAVSGNGPQIGAFLARLHHGLSAVLVRTDDEVYRVDSVWLGPPRATFPWRARYVSYGLGLVVMILVMFVQRRVGIGLDFFSVAWALVLTIVVTRFLGKRIDYERPLGQVVELFRHEVRGPRARTAVAGGPVRAGHVRLSRARTRPKPARGPDEGAGPCRGVRSDRRRAAIPAVIPAATRAGRCPPRSRAGGVAATWRARRTCPSTPRTSRCARSTAT